MAIYVPASLREACLRSLIDPGFLVLFRVPAEVGFPPGRPFALISLLDRSSPLLLVYCLYALSLHEFGVPSGSHVYFRM